MIAWNAAARSAACWDRAACRSYRSCAAAVLRTALELAALRRVPLAEEYSVTGPKPDDAVVWPAPKCTRAALGPTLVRSPRLEARTRTPGATLIENPMPCTPSRAAFRRLAASTQTTRA